MSSPQNRRKLILIVMVIIVTLTSLLMSKPSSVSKFYPTSAAVVVGEKSGIFAADEVPSRQKVRGEEMTINVTGKTMVDVLDTMQQFCSRRPKPMSFLAGEFIGFGAYGQKLLCRRGRRLWAEFPTRSSSSSPSVDRTSSSGRQTAFTRSPDEGSLANDSLINGTNGNDGMFQENGTEMVGNGGPVSDEVAGGGNDFITPTTTTAVGGVGAATVDNTNATTAGETDPSQPQKPSSVSAPPRRSGKSFMPVSHKTMRWKQNRVQVKVRDVSDGSLLDLQSNSTNSPLFTISSHMGVLSSVYFQAYHIHMNTLIPLVPVLRRQCGGADLEWECPPIDVTLYRELPNGASLVGGENFSLYMAEALGVNGGTSAILRALKEEEEDSSETICYCDGVLHNMVDVVTVPPTQKIALGDPVRRAATLFVKQRINERHNLLPFGTYPIPTEEWTPYGLWTSPNAAIDHSSSSSSLASSPPIPRLDAVSVASTAAAAPRLLFLLRNGSRELAQADIVEAMARRIGFNVQVMYPEKYPISVQARAARYTDVMLAVHGQAMTWSLMMDGVNASHCRVIVELQYFGKELVGFDNCYEVMAADNYLRYYRVPAVAANIIGVNCSKEDCRQIKRRLFEARNPVITKGFHKQRVYTNLPRLEKVLMRVFRKVSECVVKNKPVPLSSGYLAVSSAVKVHSAPKNKKHR